MPFTGVPVVVMVADGICRITGITLDTATAGVVGLAEAAGDPTPDLLLPARFKPRRYSSPDGTVVELQDSVDATVKHIGVGSAEDAASVPVNVQKSGTTLEDFRISFANMTVGVSTDSDELEIYIKFHE